MEAERIDALNVHDNGRITLPAENRERLGILVHDVVSVKIVSEGEPKQFKRKVSSGGRTTIPSRIRDKLGIEDGDHIDVELSLAESAL